MAEQTAPRRSSDLVRRVQERYGSLRPSERVVADHLRERAGQRLDASITEFAHAIGVSEATVSRVSRALGYAGFSDLKLSLAEGAGTREGFANIPVEIEEGDSPIANSARLASLLAASIHGTQRLLDADRLDRCIAAIQGARKTTLVGVGGAAAICDEAAHLFMKAGFDVSSHNDAYTQVIAAANLGPGSVMIGVSHTGTTQVVANALRLARSNGAATIAITSDAASIVAREAEVTLVTASSGAPSVPLYGDFLEGRISQLFLIDLIYLGLLFKDGERSARHLKSTASALEKYFDSAARSG